MERLPDSERLAILRKAAEDSIITPLKERGWSVDCTGMSMGFPSLKIVARNGACLVRIAVLEGAFSDRDYLEMSKKADYIFFRGNRYEQNPLQSEEGVPVGSLDGFLSALVDLDEQVASAKPPKLFAQRPKTIKHLTAENPLEAVFARLQQFTSVNIAARLVKRRSEAVGVTLSREEITSKATGVAYSMRSALDYVNGLSADRLNRRVLGLYYSVMAFAQAEMLAHPSGPVDLDTVEGMTKFGHGLYTFAIPNGGFAELGVGVLANGFFPKWAEFLGHDISAYPKARAKNYEEFEILRPHVACSLRDLFASMPEIDDLFVEVFGGGPNWISVQKDDSPPYHSNPFYPWIIAESTYCKFFDRSETITKERLKAGEWPLASIRKIHDFGLKGNAFGARVDHNGQGEWLDLLPVHSSPFLKNMALLFPTVGGLREYRAIAAVTLYALSIMARYMPSAWQRIEGGDEDQYFALVSAALAVWERILPEQFLESIAGEAVHTTQPGSRLS